MDPAKIIVSVNGDGCDEKALRLACGLVKKQKGRIFVVNVVEVARTLPLESPDPTDVERGEAILQRMESVARDERCTIEAELLQAREAGPALVEEAIERKADLIVMGLEYKMRHGEFDLGTTIPYVLKRAPCRVWVAREPAPNGIPPAPQ